MTVFRELGTLRIGRRKWKFGTARLKHYRGHCLTPKRNDLPGYVVVNNRLKVGGWMHTAAILHETLHAAKPQLSEREVRKLAATLTDALAVYHK